MDLNFLLWLQNFRNSTGDFLTPAMELVSQLAVGGVSIALLALVYWCLDKRAGLWLLMNTGLCSVVNSLIKLTACVYRPWVKNPAIVPAGNALETATGYSFPSGHVTRATALFGGLAVLQWRRKWLAGIFALIVLLVMLSRNYLGVHTPQDVLAALLVTALLMAANWKLLTWLDRKNEAKFLAAGLLLTLACLLYFSLKSYPEDFVDGRLLVDPEAMKNDSFANLGMFAGLCVGTFCERRFVSFEVAGSWRRKLLRFAIGLVPLLAWAMLAKCFLYSIFGEHVGRFLYGFAPSFYVLALYPMIFKGFERRIFCSSQAAA